MTRYPSGYVLSCRRKCIHVIPFFQSCWKSLRLCREVPFPSACSCAVAQATPATVDEIAMEKQPSYFFDKPTVMADDLKPPEGGRAQIFPSVLNLSNNILGAGLFSMPWCLSQVRVHAREHSQICVCASIHARVCKPRRLRLRMLCVCA